MHPLFARADGLTSEIIAAAVEVHRLLGPGLLESIYEWALVRELELRKLGIQQQQQVTIDYKGACRDEELRFDLLVEGCVLVEIKAVQEIHPLHKAQALSYMKLLNVPVGLVINFHELKVVDGIPRLILAGANR